MTNHPPIRKRMRRQEQPGSIRFITFSCQKRLPLLTNPKICELFVGRMRDAQQRFGLEIFAWVLMPEHVHLLCRPKVGTTLEHSLRSIKMSVARRALAQWTQLSTPILAKLSDATGRPRFWQKGGGFDRNVRDRNEFTREVQYIHRNPVKRGLVERPEDWRWSSVRWWMGIRDEHEFACDAPPGDQRSWAAWKGFK